MPISEVGHARNIQRFEEMISRVIGFGAPYNPSNASISVVKLQAKLASAHTAMDVCTNTLSANIAAINSRENTFRPLRPLVTRVVNFYASTGAETNSVNDAKGYKRKIEGRRAAPVKTPAAPPPGSPIPVPPTPTPVIHSASQTSYTQLIEHYDNLVSLVINDPLYTPNETELQKTALQNFSTVLKTANTGVIDSYTAISNGRLGRNDELYADGTGLCDLAALVKNYVKALYGASSPQFKQVSGLSFRKEKL